jgi:hypothetical protein
LALLFFLQQCSKARAITRRRKRDVQQMKYIAGSLGSCFESGVRFADIRTA